MGIEGLNISLYMFTAIVSGVVSALSVWYRLKSKVELLNLDLHNLKHEQSMLKNVFEKNKDKQHESMNVLKEEMSQMELRIIKEIHNLVKLK
jgi:hypothetical protein